MWVTAENVVVRESNAGLVGIELAEAKTVVVAKVLVATKMVEEMGLGPYRGQDRPQVSSS